MDEPIDWEYTHTVGRGEFLYYNDHVSSHLRIALTFVSGYASHHYRIIAALKYVQGMQLADILQAASVVVPLVGSDVDKDKFAFSAYHSSPYLDNMGIMHNDGRGRALRCVALTATSLPDQNYLARRVVASLNLVRGMETGEIEEAVK